MGPYLFVQEYLFCLSHREPHWIMSVDNVGLKVCIFEDLELHGHSNIFSLV